MSGEPNAIMAAIAEALPMPWTVEVTFRTKAGVPVFTWHAPSHVTAADQVVAVEIDLGSTEWSGPGLPALGEDYGQSHLPTGELVSDSTKREDGR